MLLSRTFLLSWMMLTLLPGLAWAEPSRAELVYGSKSLDLFLSTDGEFDFRVVSKATGEPLVIHDKMLVRQGEDVGPGGAIMIDPTPEGVTVKLEQATVHFSYPSPDVLKVVVTADDAEAISQYFKDQGEHVYGIWENPFSDGLDNRGVEEDFLGVEKGKGAAWVSGRAPFYVTSAGYGVYTESRAKGRYRVAIEDQTGFTFEEPTLTYYIIHGPSYRDIMQRYCDIAGGPIMPPDWAMGSIWWRNDHLKDAEKRGLDSARDLVLEDVKALQQHQIPATAYWIDRPVTSGSHGWGNQDFDPRLGDPQSLVDELEQHGLKLLIWVANRASNALKDQAEERGLLFEGRNWPAADLRSAEGYQWMADFLSWFPRQGIQGYKIDRGHEKEMPFEVENENVILMAKAAAEGLRAEHGDDFLLITRNVNDDSRQYTAVWNGDTWGQIQSVEASIMHGLRCGMIMFPTWGSDIGGYYGKPDKELWSRWLGMGAYSTLMEILNEERRNIWRDYDPEMIDIARGFAELHHELIPYTRSCLYQSHTTGWPVMTAMIFAYPDRPEFADTTGQYMYGPSLLVAPVVTEGQREQTILLPPGQWLNYNDLESVYAGQGEITVPAPLNQVPTLVPAGAIVPRGDIIRGNNNWTENWQPHLSVQVFPAPGESASFPYYTREKVVDITCEPGEQGGYVIRFGDLGVEGEVEVFCRDASEVTLNGEALSAGEGYREIDGGIAVPFQGDTVLEVQARSLFEQ
ncbi:MAG: TIM-barrel domain-containing protein [Phycisphaeraceae bacterium]